MRRRAEWKPGESHTPCPFCGHLVTILLADNMPWCVGCRVEWYRSRDGERIIFDDRRKTERFALAKAMNAAGGVIIGKGVGRADG